MITDTAEFQTALRNLAILEESLRALTEQLNESNPRLLAVTSESYQLRNASLKTDIEKYKSSQEPTIAMNEREEIHDHAERR